MAKKIYVGNLPFSATEQSLSEVFSQYGSTESVKIIMDPQSGRSRGFGFVEMSTDTEAAEAITKLDGTDLEGRTIRVSEAKSKPAGGGGGGRGGPRGGRGGGGFGGPRGDRGPRR